MRDKVGRCALVGAGEFGATFAAQASRIPRLRLDVICDRDPQRAHRTAQLNRAEEDIVICDSRGAVLSALETGKLAVFADHQLLRDLPLDVVVEATGDPRFAATLAQIALASGYSIAMATKEAESVIGPILARRAAAAGLVHTPVDGDQPSLLIALVARARSLGLPVIAAGKSTESDYVYDAAAGTLSAWGRTVPAERSDAFAPFQGDHAALAARAHPALDTRTPPDLCEMGVVANHTGLKPDTPNMHVPVARTLELPLLFRPQSAGGLLKTTGVVDAFVCLRRSDEISFAGGVFVVIETPDPGTGKLLASKGIPGSPDGRYLLLHNPVHLLGVEAPASVMSAVFDKRSTGGEDVRPHVDLIAVAERDFRPGEHIELAARHTLPDIEARLMPAAALSSDSPVPYYLAAGSRIARPVRAGAVLTLADVVIEDDNPLLVLRREQDRAFFPA